MSNIGVREEKVRWGKLQYEQRERREVERKRLNMCIFEHEQEGEQERGGGRMEWRGEG